MQILEVLNRVSIKRLVTLLVVLTTIEFSSFAHAEGGVRGGGDPYAAEVFHISRGIAKKLRAWSVDGALNLSNEQIVKVECLVDLSQEACDPKKKLEIYSFPRVYKHPEKLPSPEADETTLINIYAHEPPRIEVGRIRWDEIPDYLTKEMMVLHELIGAAGILKNGERIDDQFFISYEIKLNSIKNWEEFKYSIRLKLAEIHALVALTVQPDVTHCVAMGELMENMPQYDRVLNPSKYVSGSKRKIKNFQIDNYNEISDWFMKSKDHLGIRLNRSTQDIVLAVNQKITSFSKDIGSNPVNWQNWIKDFVTDYINSETAEREKVAREGFSSQAILNFLDNQNCSKKYCEEAESLQAMVEALKNELPLFLKSKTEAFDSKSEEHYQDLLDAISLAITPIDP